MFLFATNKWLTQLTIFAVFLVVTFFCGCSKQQQFNVLFISIDTLRADHLGCYGYQRDTSPNIDQFAQQSLLFKNFFTVVPKTGPSMTSFFTGQYMQTHGVVDNNYLRASDSQSFVQLLPDHYQKAAFVANPVLSAARGYATGFDKYQVASPNSNMGEWGQEDISPNAIAWLRAAKDKGNFFLWLHYIDPHGPYSPPRDYQDIFVNDGLYDSSRKVSLNYTPEEGINENYVLGAVPKYQRLGNNDAVDYYVTKYDAEIRYTDAEIGKVLDYLKESDQVANTIIVITADHGESLGENDYYFEHGMMVNEGSIHIPLIIHHPNINEHVVFDALMQNTDIATTLLNLISISSLHTKDGIDFSRIILGKDIKSELRKYTYSCTPYGYKDFLEAVRTKQNKLVRTNEQKHSVYDLIHDQKETTNIYHEEATSTIAELIQIVTKFGKKTQQTPVKESPLKKSATDKLRTLGYSQ